MSGLFVQFDGFLKRNLADNTCNECTKITGVMCGKCRTCVKWSKIIETNCGMCYIRVRNSPVPISLSDTYRGTCRILMAYRQLFHNDEKRKKGGVCFLQLQPEVSTELTVC